MSDQHEIVLVNSILDAIGRCVTVSQLDSLFTEYMNDQKFLSKSRRIEIDAAFNKKWNAVLNTKPSTRTLLEWGES